MKATRLKNQKGFTLIEVSLAIVIGVIVLGGAIVLYNQTKTSSANSAAGAKSLALQSLVEEMAAANSGVYPQPSSLATAWATRRSDAGQSPYGGTLAAAPYVTTNSTWPAADQTLTSPFVAPASAGYALYYMTSGTNAMDFLDENAVATKSFGNYVVSVINADGKQAFLNGK